MTGTASYAYSGDGNHAPSTGTTTIAITKASSTTAVTCPVSQTYTGSAIEACTVAVSGVGGLNPTVTPSYTSNVTVGTATASYTFAGDANHEGSTDSKTFAITKASSTTAVTGGTFVYDGTAHSPTVVVAGVGGGVTQTVMLSYTGSCISAPITVP